jgi:glyoxylase-like metal-dependent hydrolase (beta-lactamase superfamily II)
MGGEALVRVHSVQTGTVAVRTRQRVGVGGDKLRLFNTLLDPEWTEPLPILAWVVVHPEGVLVVDTGETARTSEPGYFPRWHPYFRRGLREWLEPEEEIGPQLQRLGIPPEEVRWVVLTHLHTDHAGGLHHFPQAEFFVSRRELETALGLMGRVRGYLNHRFPEWFAPRPVDFRRESFGPFAQSLPLTDAGDVHLVSTPGHTPGHLSVAVESQGETIFLAGDTSYTERLMLAGVVDGVAPDGQVAAQTLARIRELAAERALVYLPSHDPASPQRLAERARVPAYGDTRAHAVQAKIGQTA